MHITFYLLLSLQSALHAYMTHHDIRDHGCGEFTPHSGLLQLGLATLAQQHGDLGQQWLNNCPAGIFTTWAHSPAQVSQ